MLREPNVDDIQAEEKERLQEVALFERAVQDVAALGVSIKREVDFAGLDEAIVTAPDVFVRFRV